MLENYQTVSLGTWVNKANERGREASAAPSSESPPFRLALT
jgi:hypothetical protein